MDLRGRTVLITGSSSGIGAATARAMCRRGAQVLLVARSEDKLEALVRELGNSAAAYPCDASDHRAVAVMADRVQAEHGVPDVTVNSAGAGRWLSIEDTDPEEFLEMAAAPYMAAFLITRAFVEGMLARGSGWVVNVDSPASQIPWPGAVGYISARGAMRGFDAGLRADLRQSGIGVTHMVLAKVSSEYFLHNPGSEERIPAVARLVPTLTPEQAAEAICRAVEHGRREVVVPSMLRVFYLSERFMPRLTEWIAWRTGARRKASRSRGS
ncbi:SDR family NAD(P)-dependent oxidoreductase [Kribbella qitaiheensis]|uniref:SDR family NAD(P)-dependent oxidoreductase n=1 Tax=Kribbella qitaiheensis TaxID=1544730 RepID=UPI00361CE099